MLTHRIPYPPDRGDRIRSYHILRQLAEHFEVSLACTTDRPADLDQQRIVKQLTSRLAIQRISSQSSKLRGGISFLCGQAVTPSVFFCPQLARTIIDWHHQRPFDALFTYCTGMIRYARVLTNGTCSPPSRHVLDLVDVDSLKWREYAGQSVNPKRWIYAAESRRLRRIESGKDDYLDAITVVSDAEAEVYRREVGHFSRLFVVGNGVDLEYFNPLPDSDSRSMVFIGVLNYKPNVDAIVWFVERVMPLLGKRVADARLRIVGRDVSPRVRQLARYKNVEVVGPVPDVRRQLSQASVVIAPLRISPGIQNKVLEAMSSARAVVCSPGAAQGITAVDGVHLLTSKSPHEYVSHITRLMNFKSHRQAIAAAARKRLEEQYSWSQMLLPMIELVRGTRLAGDENQRPMFDAA